MTTSKSKKNKAKSSRKPASRARTRVATKAPRKSAKTRSAKKTTRATKSAKEKGSSSQTLHPRLREQSLSSERAPFPDDFHALYDRGCRASRGITDMTESHARAGSRRLTDEIKGIDVQYDEATQMPNLVLTKEPAARLSTRSVESPESAVTQFIKDRSDLWNLSPEDAETIEVVSLSQPKAEAPTVTRGRRVKTMARPAE